MFKRWLWLLVSDRFLQYQSRTRMKNVWKRSWLSFLNDMALNLILPQGFIRTAGTLEVFFDFLILVWNVRMGWSLLTVKYHYRRSLVLTAIRVHETGSRSLIPPLDREMMRIEFLGTSDSSIWRILFDFQTIFFMFRRSCNSYNAREYISSQTDVQAFRYVQGSQSSSWLMRLHSPLPIYFRRRLKWTVFLDLLPRSFAIPSLESCKDATSKGLSHIRIKI